MAIKLDNGNKIFHPKFNSDSNIKLKLGNVVEVEKTDKEIYMGDYEVSPNESEKILETENKIMSKDVTVKRVPYYEVSNPQGGTTIIIGE